MTQQQLATRLGVSQPQIARWEAEGYSSTTLSRASAAAKALGFDLSGPSELLSRETSLEYTPIDSKSDEVTRALERLGAQREALAAFARSHGIARLEFFGSVLTGEFGPKSDVDILVTYRPGRTPSLLGAVDYETELRAMLHRPVDLITRASIERARTGARRRAILDGARVIYAEE